jgi:hypothetical protein
MFVGAKVHLSFCISNGILRINKKTTKISKITKKKSNKKNLSVFRGNKTKKLN